VRNDYVRLKLVFLRNPGHSEADYLKEIFQLKRLFRYEIGWLSHVARMREMRTMFWFENLKERGHC
jgi:hypothetical protein